MLSLRCSGSAGDATNVVGRAHALQPYEFEGCVLLFVHSKRPVISAKPQVGRAAAHCVRVLCYTFALDVE